MHRHPRGFVFLLITGMTALGSCSRTPPPEPQDDFTVEAALPALVSYALDDAFLGNLQALAERATRGPDFANAYARFALGGLAVALVEQHPALPRLIRGDLRDPGTLPRFFEQVAQKIPEGPESPALALQALSLAFGAQQGDVTPALDFARGDHPAAPAVRLLLASRLLAALASVAEVPEVERGPAFQRAFPTLPNPPSSDILNSAFPRALSLLSDLLRAGPGPEEGLRRAYDGLRARAAEELGRRPFPLPLPSSIPNRSGAPMGGLTGPYTPLFLWVVTPEGAHPAFRPAVRLGSEGVVPVVPDPEMARRGSIPAEALGPRRLPLPEETRTALQALVRAAAELEPLVWPALTGIGILSGEREARGFPALVDIRDAPVARLLHGALAALTEAGFSDLRLNAPGTVGRSVPVFFRKPPSLPGIPPLEGRRVLVLAGTTAAKVFAPSGTTRMAKEGWPDGVQVSPVTAGPFLVIVPWTPETGFQGRLSRTVGLMRERSGAGVPVDIVPESSDLPVLVLLDAAQEVFLSPGTPFSELGTWFPGLSCAQGGACPAAVPVLFSDARPPKEQKSPVAVTETRPAGFCDRQAVQKTIMGRSGAYRACYEQELQRYGRLEGRLELRFTIEPDGSVSGITVVRNELNRTVEECVVRQVQQLKFPRPDGGICVISWPFRFQPGG